MSDLKKWEFPFPQGNEMLQKLKTKQTEYHKRLTKLLFGLPSKPTDLMRRFHVDEDEGDSDFRLLYFKLVIISAVIAAADETDQSAWNGVAIPSRHVTAGLSPIFRIYQFPDDFNNACQVVQGYLTGEISLETSADIPTIAKTADVVS